jgi:predicted enzyme related to lactoylglutathione lyase
VGDDVISHVFVGVGDFGRAMDFYSGVFELCVCCHDAPPEVA